jgi:hypothetical protein
VTQPPAGNTENNTNTVIGSSVSNSSVIAGSHAKASVSVGVSEQDQEVTRAISELRQGLQDAKAAIDRGDDDTRETLDLALSRLSAIEEELQEKPRSNWPRVTKLMAGIRDALTGLTGLTTSVDALWNALEKVIR